MIEKPMACSLKECDAIIARARETGTRVVVDHVRCYAPAYLWLREQIASGRWGQLKTIWMQRPGIGLGCNAVHSFAAITMLAGASVERVTGWVDPPVGQESTRGRVRRSGRIGRVGAGRRRAGMWSPRSKTGPARCRPTFI